VFVTVIRLAVAGVISLAGVARPATAADDQERIDAALASSSLRLLQAGFWSVGPGEQDGGFVSTCLGGLDAPGRLDQLPGEVARDVSNVYLFQPDAERSPEIGELLTVALITVDESSRDALDWFVLLLGSPETAECRHDEFMRARDDDPGSADVDVQVSVQPLADLGIGDASARVYMGILFSRGGAEQAVRYTFLVSRVDRTLVVVRSARFGNGPVSGIQPQAELAAIVRSLGSS
jgi:hypothetical protein